MNTPDPKLLPMVRGKNVSTGIPTELPIAADGLSVPVTGTLTATIDESTLATSAKQDTGNTSLATIAASAAGSKTAGQATAANSVPVVLASDQGAIPNVVVTSTDTGQNLSLGDTASHQFASAACKAGILVSCPLANTAAVYIGLASGVTSGSTGKGIELQPGDREFIPLGVGNATQIWAITGTATQNVHALAI